MTTAFQSGELPDTGSQSSIIVSPHANRYDDANMPGDRFPTRAEDAHALLAPPLRPDLQAIADLIPGNVMALDLGCANGELLEYLVRARQIKGRGIELSEEGVLACVRRGLSVRQGNLQEGLADYPDGSFDYVILAQTLPFLDDPAMVLNEMLRVGRHAIISFSNWGYWRCRLELLLTGRIPQAPDLPQRWYDVPRWQAFTITDFGRYCKRLDVKIDHQVYLSGDRIINVRRYKNLLSTTAVFGLSAAKDR